MFVLAHLSDPHLGPVPIPRFRELTGKRALGFVNWHRRRFVRHRPEALEALVHDLRSAAPDHIAVTGDLVNIALEKEFPPAREWLAQLGSPHDVSMVPGNHAAYVRHAIEQPAPHWGDYLPRRRTGTTTCIRSTGSRGRSIGSRSSACRRPRRHCAGTAIRPATISTASTASAAAGAAR